ncbi:MAG TPA: BT4734/BF3469 family protein [Puia sp.]|jgi:hypothetical protein|nr:BT4734/BF3469 family protein [Puia sp.]
MNHKMNWMNKQVSLYVSHADNIGRPATVGEILLTEFASFRKWKGDRLNDMETIVEIRNLDRSAPDYRNRKLALKATLQCYTPAGLLVTKEHGKMALIHWSGLLQLDFDQAGIADFDLEELKQCVFALPFIAFCGLSCSGDGFYALACIAEPERLADYAEHLFLVLEDYGIKADQSKGKKVENLRYVSYDSNMLIRDNPEILRVTNFRTKPAPQKSHSATLRAPIAGHSALVRSELAKIAGAVVNQRWDTVQRVAFTLGGLGDSSLIYAIKAEIEANPEFNGQEAKYIKCAQDCFAAGAQKPLSHATH